MRDRLILIWRKMKKIKMLRLLNKLIFKIATSNLFNIGMDYIDVHILHNNYLNTRKYYDAVKDTIKNNYDNLADKKSKQVYMSLIKYRETHKRKYFQGIVDDQQYFPTDLICWKGKECLVDCGAYDGDTIKQFKNLLKNENIDWSVVAFEPDAYNFNLLRRSVQLDDECRKKVELHRLGTWDKKMELRFQNGMDDSSRISDNGETVISVNTIDNIIGDRTVTFIKMDVEGAELKSLKGAKETILRDHPRLAISIYHSDQDMVEIIDYLLREYPFYKLYIRHYTWLFADTVCYAIDPAMKEK